MKLCFVISLFALASTGFSSAALYRIDNGGGSTASGIVDSAGRAFRNGTSPGDAFSGAAGGTSAGPGVVAVGIFSTDSFSSFTTASQLISAFTNFGNSAFAFSAVGATGNRGIVFFSPPAVTVAGSPFEGKNLYLFAGNGISFASSTEFLIVKSNSAFDALQDLSPIPATITFRPSLGTTLFGSVIPDVKTTSNDSSITEGWQMAVIPEPSAALLGAIGALGLLRRRRN